MLFGIRHDQVDAVLYGLRLQSEDAILLASDLSVSHSLTSLTVASNKIVGQGAQQLASAVLAKPTLVDFSGIPLKQLRANRLTKLELPKKGLGVPEAMVLSELLQSVNTSVTSLNLAFNEIGPEGAASLAAAVAACGSITRVDVSNNFLQAQGVKSLREAAGSRREPLQSLLVGRDGERRAESPPDTP